MPDPRRSTPHPFAWILIAALALAIVYLLAVIGWMAWNGQALRRIELPGGAALERDTEELDSAAAGFDGFSQSVVERLDALDAAMISVNDRIDRIEGGSDSPDSRVP